MYARDPNTPRIQRAISFGVGSRQLEQRDVDLL